MGSSILFVSLGSWGDVAPVLSIARELRPLGVDARLGVATDYVQGVEDAGFEAIDLGVDMASVMVGDIGQAWVGESSRGQQATVAATRRLFAEIGPPAISAMAAAVRSGEMVVSGVMTFPLGAALAEIGSSRHVQLLFLPLSATRSPGATAFPITPWPSALNRWSADLAQASIEKNNRDWTDQIRTTLGLRSWTKANYLAALQSTPVLYGVSPQFLPPPPDWPGQVTVSGHLLDEDEQHPPDGLPEFLAEHPSSIFVGFGSLGGSLTVRDWDVITEAVELAGTPAVIAGHPRPAAIGSHSRTVFTVGQVSHTWLFRRLVGVVHHAGAGTAQRATLSGVPSVAVPLVGDQPYWARRLAALRVAPEPVPYSRLNPRRLAGAIKAMVTNPEYSRQAQRISRAMSDENGPTTAACFLQQVTQ